MELLVVRYNSYRILYIAVHNSFDGLTGTFYLYMANPSKPLGMPGVEIKKQEHQCPLVKVFYCLPFHQFTTAGFLCHGLWPDLFWP